MEGKGDLLAEAVILTWNINISKKLTTNLNKY